VTAVELVAVGVGVVAVTVGGIRWLRVAQREHYLAGSCLVVAGRWMQRRPPNQLLMPATVAVAVAAVVGGAIDGGWSAPLALLASASAAVLPWPFPLRGKSAPLRFTRRARVLAVVALAIALGAAFALSFAIGWAASLAVVAVACCSVVDLALAITAPFERRAMERHRRRAEVRLRAVAPRVIAVTGSWGKTSTKNHIADLLGHDTEVVASPASWNNVGGLSRAINEHLTDTTAVFVAEMGMYRPGEIRALCEWVRPEIGVLLAVGPMHLERAGSLEAIAAAKAEILERVGQAVVWVDDERVDRAAALHVPGDARVWRVGTTGRSGLDVSVATVGDELVFADGAGELARHPVAGGGHPANLACALAAVLALGVDRSTLATRLRLVTPPSHRAVVARTDGGVTVIDDTFSSNPEGARSALRTLRRLGDGGATAVVTPGMVELGAAQEDENRALAAATAEAGATLVVVGWTNRRALTEGAGTAGGRVVVVADRDAARTWVRGNLQPGDAVLWENDLPDHYP
jgi:UDP-N-acetylmuramoyl-tripeptide--D-alanyl-D-alanine ligase